jgi:hypothetical protein
VEGRIAVMMRLHAGISAVAQENLKGFNLCKIRKQIGDAHFDAFCVTSGRRVHAHIVTLLHCCIA